MGFIHWGAASSGPFFNHASAFPAYELGRYEGDAVTTMTKYFAFSFLAAFGVLGQGCFLQLTNATSNQSQGTISTTTTPTTTTSSTVLTGGTSKIQISWQAPSQAVTGYVIRLSSDNLNFTNFQQTSGTTTTALLSGLVAGSTYYIQVESVNSAGESGPSQTLTVAIPNAL
jgi:hypothetical protein